MEITEDKMSEMEARLIEFTHTWQRLREKEKKNEQSLGGLWDKTNDPIFASLKSPKKRRKRKELK